jgi:hypothetical protein
MFPLRILEGAPVSGRRVRRDNYIVSIKSNYPGDFCEGITERNRLVRLYIMGEPEWREIMKQAVRLMMTAWAAVAGRHAHLMAAAIAALFVLSIAGLAHGQGPGSMTSGVEVPARMIESRLERVEEVKHPGSATFGLNIWAPKWNTECRTITVKLVTVGNLELRGEAKWHLTLVDSAVYKRNVEIVIPDHDTSGIEVTFSCNNDTRTFGGDCAFFVPEGDSVKIFRGDPRGFDFPRTQVPIADLPPTGRRVKGEFPHSDSLYPIPEDTVKLPTVTYHREDRIAAEQATQDSLERFPLTDRSIQYVTVDGQTLERRKGETKFHPIESKTFAEWTVFFQKRHDSAMEANKNVRSDTWIDLHNPADLAFAKSLIDSLLPTDTAGIYRAAINRSTFIRLSEKGIRTRKWGTLPGQRKPIPVHPKKDKLNMGAWPTASRWV